MASDVAFRIARGRAATRIIAVSCRYNLSGGRREMAKPRVLVLRAPGANCDAEAAFAFEQAGATAERVHINRLREDLKLTSQYQILVVPGGFTFGDDVAAGKILANQLTVFLGDQLRAFRDKE